MHTVKSIPLAQILTDSGTQTRAEQSAATVNEYSELLGEGTEFPALDVVEESPGRYLLVDGFHRLAAARRQGKLTFPCRVTTGSLEDAVWAAAAANVTHGLRRSNADKRRAVQAALNCSRSKDMTSREIAQHCGVHHATVCEYLKLKQGSVGIRQTEPTIRAANRQTGSAPPEPGHVIEEKCQTSSWSPADRREATIRALGAFSRELGKLLDSTGGQGPYERVRAHIVQLSQLIEGWPILSEDAGEVDQQPVVCHRREEF